MNRPIKFRAFYKDCGEPEKPHGSMFYDVMPCAVDFSEWLISFDSDGSYDGYFKVGEDIEVMQFTGLHDKNGKEIYEGDILKGAGDATVVEWIGGEWGYKNLMWGERKEVIGNIYEHGHLLTDKGV